MIAELALAISAVSVAAAAYSAVQARRANQQSAKALSWQQELEKKRSSPDVRIEFEHRGRASAQVIDPNNPRRGYQHYELTINVVNYGETPEQLRSLAIKSANRDDRLDLTGRLVGSPKLEPHTHHSVDVNAEKLPTSTEGYVGIARLSRGPEIVSAVERLNATVMAAVNEHNSRVG